MPGATDRDALGRASASPRLGGLQHDLARLDKAGERRRRDVQNTRQTGLAHALGEQRPDLRLPAVQVCLAERQRLATDVRVSACPKMWMGAGVFMAASCAMARCGITRANVRGSKIPGEFLIGGRARRPYAESGKGCKPRPVGRRSSAQGALKMRQERLTACLMVFS